ncbi:unnamed protein product [Owenia fusiformis]|uniref:Uncharacterized protein n=1 Tax=Owenia fusiformis TaxID=6347 RepID=A0A8J1XFS7_OWEFU|nr:unnamed protein product [Owenia fusiformis]
MLFTKLLSLSAFVTVVMGNFPQRKTWWANHITDDYYTAGRLSARQVKYTYEAGFKSIISIFNFTAGVKSSAIEEFPTTDECMYIAKNLCGMPYAVVLSPGDSWQDISLVERFTAIADQMPKPTLVHCGVGYSSTFTLLNYFANKTKHDPEFTPKIKPDDVFEIGAIHGFDYSDNALKELVSEVTGWNVTDNVTVPDIPMGQGWWHYWHATPVYKDIFMAGQIYATTGANINSTGFRSIINVRKGLTAPDGTLTQEEVTLLNIKDNTGTYVDGGRQTTPRLEASRIDPNISNQYISRLSPINYEMKNLLEFGDDIGYNEELERKTFEDFYTGVKYYHHPTVGQTGFTNETWNNYRADSREAIQRGPVLYHCRTGKRAAVWAILAAADYYSLGLDWAMKRSKELGVPFDDKSPEVALWRSVLIGEYSSGQQALHSSIVPSILSILSLQLLWRFM